MLTPPNGPRLSLCMIVRNEAENLPACLESVAGIVDEIVAVDTGSTDGTAEVVRAAGGRVSRMSWQEDFAGARNRSLQEATGDWVLVLDADERLVPGGQGSLRQLMDAPDVAGYLVQLCNPTHGGEAMGMTHTAWLPRLFRRLPGVQYTGPVHECVLSSLQGRGRIPYSPLVIDHRGYLRGPAAMREKAQRNLRILLRELQQAPRDARIRIQLAEIYGVLGRIDEAIADYRTALALITQASLQDRPTVAPATAGLAAQQLGAALLIRQRPVEAIAALRQALAYWPHLASAHVYLGQAHARLGESTRALAHLERAIALAEAPSPPEHPVRLIPWFAWFLKGSLEANGGRHRDAERSLCAALRLKPDLREAHELLGLIRLLDGRARPALSALETARSLGSPDAPLLVNLGIARRQVGDLMGALSVLERARRLDPGDSRARIHLEEVRALLRGGTAGAPCRELDDR